MGIAVKFKSSGCWNKFCQAIQCCEWHLPQGLRLAGMSELQKFVEKGSYVGIILPGNRFETLMCRSGKNDDDAVNEEHHYAWSLALDILLEHMCKLCTP